MLRIQKPLEYNNRMPRSTNPDDFGPYATLIKRCIACHQNSLESFPAFAFAVVLCKVQKVKQPLQVAKLCFQYLAMRILYTVFYIAGRNDLIAALRTVTWVGGIQAVWRLFMLAL